jgi:putative hydrolase of HD superfamily
MAKFFDHFLNRNLAHVVRFNNRPQHFPESVAEHSYYVAYFSLLLCRVMEKNKLKVNSAKVLQMALIHDSEEGFSGDILNPFKHYNDRVFQAIREVNREMVGEVFADLPDYLNSEMVEIWKEENAATSLEAQVVKVADKLSLLSKCFEEIAGGNSYFKEIYSRELRGLANLQWSWWVKIRREVLAGS